MAPFKSEAQRKFMYAAEKAGKVKKGTAAEFEKATHGSLPEKLHPKKFTKLSKLMK